MNRRSFLASIAVAGGSLMFRRSAGAESMPPLRPPAPSDRQSALICEAAAQFLQTLAPALRDKIVFPFPKGQTPAAIGFGPMPGRPGGGPGAMDHPRHDVAFDIDGNPITLADPHGGPKGSPPGDHNGAPPVAGEKFGDAVWTNFPVSVVHRPGVQMGEFTPDQRDAVHSLLKLVLSPMGYQKVLDIMAADQKVADAGADYAAGENVYTLGIFGQPSTTAPWMLQFGGHHLGLNVTFVGDKAVCAPLHTGILPAKFVENGKIIRGLGRENDKAFDLLATLSPSQLKAALIAHNVSELVFGPGHTDAKLTPQGLRGADMSEQQRSAMFNLISEWVGILNDAHAATRRDEIRQSLADTRFAWAGPTTCLPSNNGEAYFRIHGPTLLIEYAPQSNQGGYKVHVHTIMRDLQNDYAKRLI